MSLQRCIRVILADDHAMVRQALAGVLDQEPNIDVVAQANSGGETIEALRQQPADVIVLDYTMPGVSASQVIAWLLRDAPQAKVLVLTVHESPQYAVKVLESGAHGFLIKSAAVEELVQAIQAVHRGEIYLSSKLSSEILHLLRQPKRKRSGLDSLSQREFDLVRHLAAGRTLQEAAKEMKVSTSTASTYRARVMEKLDLDSTGELIRFALENQIVG